MSSFTLFPDLPTELRLHIWNKALPDYIPPALFSWKPRCWKIRFLMNNEPESEPNRDDLNLVLEFRHSMLGPARFHLPLVSVNNEARGIALSWAAENGIDIDQVGEKDGPVLKRAFDPESDAIYFPLDCWNDFLYEAANRAFEPDLVERNYSNRTEVYQIAVPEMLLHRGPATGLKDVFDSFPFLKVLYVVTGAHAETNSSNGEEDTPFRWEINKAQSDWEIVWAGNQSDWNIPMDKTNMIDDALRIGILDTAKELQEGLRESSMRNFKIRVVRGMI
ncbi:hypothetical protein N0V82_002703 [Gnomoniopsis sp. IMI 355080]|nr:hypothetical protein N0V82_002703 [Gnomoniopsis sp. IMI 355080]